MKTCFHQELTFLAYSAEFHCNWSIDSQLLLNSNAINLSFQRVAHLPPENLPPTPLVSETTALFRYVPNQLEHGFQQVSIERAPKVYTFLIGALLDLLDEETHANCAAFKLLVPIVDGYISRSDVISMRLNGSVLVEDARDFCEPLQLIRSKVDELTSAGIDIFTLCSGSVGGVRLRAHNPEVAQNQLVELKSEFLNRLSFNWISTTPVTVKRLAFVQGRPDAESSIKMWQAARALGISLVILDAKGHWLQDPKWSNYREAFVAVDITPDEELPERLICAMRNYGKPFDGIMTVSDSRLPAIARVAELLGFATSPAEAYDIAGDKFRTRQLEPSSSESFECTSVEQACNRIAASTSQPLKFPLIVKPCTGWGSECVSRVENEAMLIEAVAKACDRHQGFSPASTACVVEPYISGPEFDANFVLLNGEILFSEIADDYPSRGDGDLQEAASNCDFLETQVVSATRLPEDEQIIIRDQVHASILRQGFKSGVFHCEGRVRDSSVEFQRNSSTGHMELVRVKTRSLDKASSYLIENNARPPGYTVSSLARLTYGVDYFALQMLFALGPSETERFKAMSRPFCNGPQYYSMVQYVSPSSSGVLLTEDPGKEMANRCPELVSRDNVAISCSPKRKGDRIYGPETKEVAWISRYIVTSRQSLNHLLDIGAKIVDEFQYELSIP